MTHLEFQKRYTYNVDTDKLGEGGFGSVFKAYDNYRDRWVAVKISKVSPQFETIRLKKEVKMVSKLTVHPNIAYYEECYTFSSFDGTYDFGILQYYEEGNLSQLLKNKTLTPTKKQSILVQILDGVDFLHQNGIIHRDLKPQNILLVKRGDDYIPKITDFGISKQLDINKSAVFSNSLAGAGTLFYASPEQMFDREIRKNTDLWSYGVIVFHALTGHLPFNTGNYAATSEAGRAELFRQVSNGQLSEITATIAEPWQTLIRACLITNPATRIKNTQEAKDILEGRRGACPPTTIPPQIDTQQLPTNDKAQIDTQQPLINDQTQIDSPTLQPLSNEQTQIDSPLPPPQSNETLMRYISWTKRKSFQSNLR